MPDNTENENNIQKLLRLKRYEQPPAGYHERFLQEFHRRQRAEMLREPLWRIAIERLGAFFSEHSMGRMAYGTATLAVLLFAGVSSYHMLENGGVAQTSSPAPVMVQNNSNNPTSTQLAADAQLTLRGPIAGLQSTNLPGLNTTSTSDPHYILGSRPVSYERPFSF